MPFGTISAHVEIDGTVPFGGEVGVAARFCMDRSGIGASFHCNHNMLRVTPHMERGPYYQLWTYGMLSGA